MSPPKRSLVRDRVLDELARSGRPLPSKVLAVRIDVSARSSWVRTVLAELVRAGLVVLTPEGYALPDHEDCP